jgi:hypothetical protein
MRHGIKLSENQLCIVNTLTIFLQMAESASVFWKVANSSGHEADHVMPHKPEDVSSNDQTKSGMEFSEFYWNTWNLMGRLESYGTSGIE